MSDIVVLGEPPRIELYALAGARVVPAHDEDQVRRAWDALEDDIEVVILTPAAAAAVADDPRPRRLTVVMPE